MENVKVPKVGLGFWIKLLVLGLINALVVYVIPFFWGNWLPIVGVILVTLLVDWIYLSSKQVARGLKWIAPGLVFFIFLTIVPVIFNGYIAFTNYSLQHFLPKDQVVESLAGFTFEPENPETLKMYVFEDEATEARRLLLETDEGDLIFAVPRTDADERFADEDAVEDLASLAVVDDDGDGLPETIGDYRRLLLRDLVPIADDLGLLIVDLPGRGEGQVNTLNAVTLKEQRYRYNETTDVLVDVARDVRCPADNELGSFVCEDTRGAITPGWPVPIGFDNFSRVWTNEGIREPFLRVFFWNLTFAVLSVVLTLGLGMILALALNDERLKGRKFYRSMYILPYAIPVIISAAIWRGLLNTNFGQINKFINPVVELVRDDPIPWLQDPLFAKAGVLLLQLWLGFPYMFLIVTGALQSIPAELQEAARVDGATSRQVFRRVTFPLLMVSIGPLLIGSFAFNFNNFIPIFILTTGGPPLTGYAVPVGETDILITFTYNLAVSSGRGGQFALAAALSFFIFFMVGLISAFSFRFTKRLEETYGAI